MSGTRLPSPILVLLLAGSAALAGCADAPAVPDHAATARDDALPGLVLHAWSEAGNTGIVLHAVLENRGDGFYDHRGECGHPWHSRILAPDGSEVHPKRVEPCQEFFYERLAPGHHLEFRHTWDLHDHGAPDAAGGTQGPGADTSATRVPAGTYTWSFTATVIGPRAGDLRTDLPLEVPAAADGAAGEAADETGADPAAAPS